MKTKHKGMGGKLKVLFGSIEYFEKEIMSFAKKKSSINLAREQVMEIYSEMKDELMNDFICDEHIKKECLHNLNLASQRFLHKYQAV
ncbi:endoglucanase Acf2 [Bacillus sp. SLBN-46]|uniref:hypothetical protein n=1 Tax=Bacillus sp. SLBN-46 TaxID=3042283 RepID=UPI00285921AF|nr:hypothetical protein [Bacillus sp. SLBN-46]MDR6121872.1 endoglucanase Acf2 [Bacillus sp. SLBN-46]